MRCCISNTCMYYYYYNIMMRIVQKGLANNDYSLKYGNRWACVFNGERETFESLRIKSDRKFKQFNAS